MATKCIVLVEHHKEPKKRRIEFRGTISRDGTPRPPYNRPSNWKNIELISKNYSPDLGDCMFAYDDDKTEGILYFGQWNDGVVG